MSLEKALITNTETGDRVPVLFNPEEYTLKKEITYAQAAVPGLIAPLLQFVHGNLETLDMELLVDTYEKHDEGSQVFNQAGEDVRTLTRKVTDLMRINPQIHAPPVLLFTWASLSFSCVLASVSQRFIMFLPDGTPVRARLQVSFHEFRNAELEAKETKNETADFSKLYLVSQGETLSAIAGRVYDNPTAWRPIAIRNDIDNPRRLTTGTRLIIPQLPFRHPDTGAVLS
jgi:Contractile injection system tube protein/LysM domain